MREESINILIVDDHSLVREGLIHYLSRYPEFHVCGEANSGKMAIHLESKLKPDIVIQDLFLPDMDGLLIIRKMVENNPDVKILVLTGFTAEELVFKAIRAGASGFLYKDTLHNELANAIHAILSGDEFLAPKAMAALIKFTKNDFSNDSDLTCREEEVLYLVARGKTNSQIANTLLISCSTVDFHIGNILSKLNVSNRTEAVVKAMLDNKIKMVD